MTKKRREGAWKQVTALVVLGTAGLYTAIVFQPKLEAWRDQILGKLLGKDEAHPSFFHQPVAELPPQHYFRKDIEGMDYEPEGYHSQELSAPTTCRQMEFSGGGPLAGILEQRQRSRLSQLFSESQESVLKWLEGHHTRFGADGTAVLRERVSRVHLEMSPPQESPDLAWRGIATWMGKEMKVQLGSGFIRLAELNPVRARFEMVRALVQSWSPCELENAGMKNPWMTLTQCFGIDDACEAGSESEGGWAVSSLVAAAVVPLGCRLGALEEDSVRQCVESFALGTESSGERHLAKEKESKEEHHE